LGLELKIANLKIDYPKKRFTLKGRFLNEATCPLRETFVNCLGLL